MGENSRNEWCGWNRPIDSNKKVTSSKTTSKTRRELDDDFSEAQAIAATATANAVRACKAVAKAQEDWSFGKREWTTKITRKKRGALATLSRFRSFQNPSCKITGCDQIVVGTRPSSDRKTERTRKRLTTGSLFQSCKLGGHGSCCVLMKRV